MGTRPQSWPSLCPAPRSSRRRRTNLSATSLTFMTVCRKAGGGPRVSIPVFAVSSNKKTKHMLPDGFKKFLINNVSDLELLMMYNRSYAAEVASSVSRKTREAILERAKVLDIKVTNASARMRTEESE